MFLFTIFGLGLVRGCLKILRGPHSAIFVDFGVNLRRSWWDAARMDGGVRETVGLPGVRCRFRMELLMATMLRVHISLELENKNNAV
jgi:hypothetical protein